MMVNGLKEFFNTAASSFINSINLISLTSSTSSTSPTSQYLYYKYNLWIYIYSIIFNLKKYINSIKILIYDKEYNIKIIINNN